MLKEPITRIVKPEIASANFLATSSFETKVFSEMLCFRGYYYLVEVWPVFSRDEESIGF